MRIIFLSTAWLMWCLILSSRAIADGELIQVTQDFSEDPGWEWMNNRIVAKNPPTINQDFGWSPTNHTGAGPGEIGGRVWMSRTPAYYALPLNKPLSFKDKFSFSARVAFMPTGGGAVAYLGFFNHSFQSWRVWNSMALRLGGETSGQAGIGMDCMTAIWDIPGGTEGYRHVPADGKPHTIKFSYDPNETRGASPHPNLEKYIIKTADQKGYTAESILEQARKDEPELTLEQIWKRLEEAHEAGWLHYKQRTGHESIIGFSPFRGRYWIPASDPTPRQGAATLQVDDHPPIKLFMVANEIGRPVYMDRFGLFNLQLYHQYIDLYIGDLTVNGHKVDLSKDPGWEAKGNRVKFVEQDFQRQNFGYSETNWAGDGIGEIGGLFSITEAQDPYHGYYVDDVGKLTLDDPISFSGKVCMAQDSTDAGMQFGYFNSEGLAAEGEAIHPSMTNLNSMGVLIDDHVGGKCFGLSFTTGNTTEVKKKDITFQGDKKSHSFTFNYDPKGNNNLGRITATFDDKTSVLDLTPQQRDSGIVFDRFGVANTRDGGKYVVVYLDDLSYTARRPKGFKPIFHEQKIVEVPYPKGGRAF
jgi:hypothetical protein